MNYCKNPVVEVPTEQIQAWRGYGDILSVLGAAIRSCLDKGKCILAVETYPGVDDKELTEALSALSPSLFVDMRDGLCSKEEYRKRIYPFMTDDRVFGYMYNGTLADFQDADRMEALRQRVAEATGLVTHLEAWQGKALFEEGDTVVEGDVVISGWMPIEPPPYSGITDLGGRAVRAEGRVEARTWRILQAAVPLEAETKEYTGRETDFYSLIFFGKRLNFYRNSRISYDEYDKITKIQWLTMPGGQTLPIALLSEQVRETELLSLPVETEGAVELLSEELNDRLALLVEDGEVVGREISWEQNGGLLTVRLLAECREEIGKTVEWPS